LRNAGLKKGKCRFVDLGIIGTQGVRNEERSGGTLRVLTPSVGRKGKGRSKRRGTSFRGVKEARTGALPEGDSDGREGLLDHGGRLLGWGKQPSGKKKRMLGAFRTGGSEKEKWAGGENGA